MWRSGDLNKLLRQPWRERTLLLEAAVWLGILRAALLLLPFRRIARLLGLEPGESPPQLEQAMAKSATRVGWAIAAAAPRTPWESTCLTQALASSALLRRRGVPGTLYLGVARDAGVTEELSAHAWMRCGDHVVTGAGGRERFSVVATFAVSERCGSASRKDR